MANILIVEDEAMIAMALKRMLSKIGHETVGIAYTAQDAMAMAKEACPDLILMDVMLPGQMDGIDAARAIKDELDSPVIFVTAYGEDSYVEKAKSTEPFGYLIKPYNEKELKATIEIALIKIEMQRRLRDLNTALQTANEKLTLQLEERETLFSSVYDVIVTVDPDMIVLSANKALERIFDVVPKDLIGKDIRLTDIPCQTACQEVLSETLQSNMPVREYHVECENQKGRTLHVVLNCASLVGEDQKIRGAVLVIRDITRQSDLERQLTERHSFHGIVGKSKKMQSVYDLLENLSQTETTVLITGESGTGKEVVAKALHFNSPRAFHPFIRVNCAALSENLLESELFGHVRGAFSGAVKDKIGRFQAADSGTILLDEIGDVSQGLQLNLLRVLQEREFERVGDTGVIQVDIRVIATTNQDLNAKVAAGTFREDLYYRLKVVEIKLPPLRERKEDIPLLTEHFIEKFNKSFNKSIQGATDHVMGILMRHDWPGNIRELEHAVEHAFVVCRSETLTTQDLPEELSENIQPRKSTRQRIAADRDVIVQTLKQTDGNKAKAARLLGISRRTIYRKIEALGLEG